MSVDARAEAAWGTDAAGYERARPGWPPPAVDWLWERLGLGADAEVLDLAAGTGKLTRDLLPRAGRVVALEPLAAMRGELVRVAPEAEIRSGVAEAIPLPDAAVDAVFVAEAFHWFAAPPALAEIRRVLRPGGGLALLWNLEGWGAEGWAADLIRMLGMERRTGVHQREARDALAADPDFGAPTERRFEHGHRVSADGLIDLVGSWSRIAAQPRREREALLARVRALVPEAGAELPYETLAMAAPQA